jgi:recombination protein RecR
MKAAEYPSEIQRLITSLKRLPGIGPRSAERIAVTLLQSRQPLATELAQALSDAVSGIGFCPQCGFFKGAGRPCAICDDPERETTIVCVVEQPNDILPIERSGAFRGLYHVLGGKISPLDNRHPEDLHIERLLARVASESIAEVILAVSSDVEGEATAHYLSAALAARPGLKVTRLAQGLPAGGGLEHIDELTLRRALTGRRAI